MSGLKKYTDYKTILSVGLICQSKGKFLLLKRAKTKNVDPGVYSVVGGKVEPGESYLKAMLREAKEEIGLTIDPDKLQPIGIKQVADTEHGAEWVVAMFTLELPEQIRIEPTEDGEFHWVDVSELNSDNTLPDILETIKILIKSPHVYALEFCVFNMDRKMTLHEIKTFFVKNH